MSAPRASNPPAHQILTRRAGRFLLIKSQSWKLANLQTTYIYILLRNETDSSGRANLIDLWVFQSIAEYISSKLTFSSRLAFNDKGYVCVIRLQYVVYIEEHILIPFCCIERLFVFLHNINQPQTERIQGYSTAGFIWSTFTFKLNYFTQMHTEVCLRLSINQ